MFRKEAISITTDNGAQYQMALPNGATYDAMIALTGDMNYRAHYMGMFTLLAGKQAAGFYEPTMKKYVSSMERGIDMGFRPVLVPVNTLAEEAVKAIAQQQANNAELESVSLGVCMTINGTRMKLPFNPVKGGDCGRFNGSEKIGLENTCCSDRDNDEDAMRFFAVNGVLVADCVMLTDISIADLALQGINEMFPAKPGNDLAGGYVLFTAYTALEDEKALPSGEQEGSPAPTVTLAVKQDWLEEFVKPDFQSVQDFLDNYTYDNAIGIQQEAAAAGALAFVRRDGVDKCGGISHIDGDKLALLDYVSGMLQEAGYGDASKFLDAMFEF